MLTSRRGGQERWVAAEMPEGETAMEAALEASAELMVAVDLVAQTAVVAAEKGATMEEVLVGTLRGCSEASVARSAVEVQAN